VAGRTLSYVTSGTSRFQRKHRAVITLESQERINATVFAIDEDKLRRCPHIKLMIGEQRVAVVD
jgi:hypothetical protein